MDLHIGIAVKEALRNDVRFHHLFISAKALAQAGSSKSSLALRLVGRWAHVGSLAIARCSIAMPSQPTKFLVIQLDRKVVVFCQANELEAVVQYANRLLDIALCWKSSVETGASHEHFSLAT